MGRLLDTLAAVGCAGAGLYLLTSQTQAGNSAFDVLFRGIGIYFLAKAVFILRSLRSDELQVELLREVRDGIAWTRHKTDDEETP